MQLDFPTFQEAKPMKMPRDSFRVLKSSRIPRSEKGMKLPKHVNLAKYFTPEFQKFAEPHRDPNGTWISIYGAIATIGWNTRMVKPADAPKDWKNLLEPKWKGKKIGLPAETHHSNIPRLQHSSRLLWQLLQ